MESRVVDNQVPESWEWCWFGSVGGGRRVGRLRFGGSGVGVIRVGRKRGGVIVDQVFPSCDMDCIVNDDVFIN